MTPRPTQKAASREPTVQIGIRLPESLLARIDGHLDLLRKETGLLSLTRTDATISLIVHGLEAADAPSKVRRRPAGG
jgi:hypothetical protein